MTVTKGAIELWPSPLGIGAERLEAAVVAGEGESLAEIPLKDLSTPTTLMFANGSPNGVSEAIVQSIEIVQP